MTVAARTKYIDVPGGYIGLKILGQNDKTIPILYVHGGPGGNYESFMPMAEKLAKDCTVYMYNQLGSDDSTNTGEESLWIPERYMEALNGVIASLNVEKLHIIAHSWGAMLAVEHVISNPGSPVISITMVSPYLSTEIWIRDAKSRLAELNAEYLNTVEECEKGVYFDSKTYQEIIMEYNKNFQCRIDRSRGDDVIQSALKPKTASGMKVYRHMWGPSEFTCTGILKDMDVTAKLQNIRVRVLIICGVYDQVKKETCEYFRSLIPGSVRVTIPDASQTSFIENPDVFMMCLLNSL